MDVHDIPTKSDALRTSLLRRIFDPKHDYSAEEFNALRDGVIAALAAGSAGERFETTVETNDDVPHTVLVWTPPDNSVWKIKTEMVAITASLDGQAGGEGQTVGAKVEGVVTMADDAFGDGVHGGTLSDVGPPIAVADGGDVLVQVTGVVGTVVLWAVVVTISPIRSIT